MAIQGSNTFSQTPTAKRLKGLYTTNNQRFSKSFTLLSFVHHQSLITKSVICTPPAVVTPKVIQLLSVSIMAEDTVLSVDRFMADGNLT